MVEKINVKSHSRKTTKGSTKVQSYTRVVDSDSKKAQAKLKEKEQKMNIVKGGDLYKSKSQVGMLKQNVSELSNLPRYFDKSNVKFFGSKVKSVYANSNNTRFVFLEELSNPLFTGKNDKDYKLGEYNYNTRTLTTTKIIENKGDVEEQYTKLRNGKTTIEKLGGN